MREILFRGKQTDKDKWIYGVPVKGKSVDESEILIIESVFECGEYACIGCEFTPVIPSTVGQYTGLTDKNGKRIFEGDIVNDEQSGYNYYIKWFPEYACFALANKNGHIEFGCDELEIFLNDLVVIGNIHDNPELLKGE